LAFSDGTEIKADVIVFATGFLGNLRQHVERLLGKDVADRAGDCFGLNEEGEILGAFKPVKRTYSLYSVWNTWNDPLLTVLLWQNLGCGTLVARWATQDITRGTSPSQSRPMS
jgi:hypothetical protein